MARSVSAAALTAFWSRGVKARSACCTRLPSWPSTASGNVERILRHEVDAHALRADQPHHLLDPVQQRLRRVVEQQVRLVEEEDELRLFRIADFRQVLEQFGQHPEQERRVELGRRHQLVGGQDVDHALAAGTGLDQVVEVEHRLAEELVAALLLEREQRRAGWRRPTPRRRCRSRSGTSARCRRRIAARAQVLQVEQQQAVVVGDLEDQRQHAGLRLVQVEQARRAAAAPSRRSWPAPGGPARRRRPRTRPGRRRTPASRRRSASGVRRASAMRRPAATCRQGRP